MGETTLIVDPADAEGYAVRDAMVRHPKTLPVEATVADLRRLFENPKVRTALLVDQDGRFQGAVERPDVSDAAPDEAEALSVAPRVTETIAPDAPLPAAIELLGRTVERRLVVVEADGTLAGLLCPNEDGTAFCIR